MTSHYSNRNLMEKSQLRQKILLKRSKVHTNALLDAIHSHLSAYLLNSNFRSVGFYWPIRSEIDLTPIIQTLPEYFQWFLPSVRGGGDEFLSLRKGRCFGKRWNWGTRALCGRKHGARYFVSAVPSDGLWWVPFGIWSRVVWPIFDQSYKRFYFGCRCAGIFC